MYDTYTIKENDTITKIANDYNTTPDIIYQLNGYIETLIPGRTLVLPKTRNNYFNYYTIEKGDTLYSIAKKYNINYNVLSELNGIEATDYIYPNQVIMIPKEGVRIYITASGDTLQGIVNGINANLNQFLNQNNNLYLLPEQLIIYKEK